MSQLNIFNEKIVVKPINNATQRHYSVFRYPGGKTWALPYLRNILRKGNYDSICEPFAGSGVVSLMAIFENFVQKAYLYEIDAEVASVWHCILSKDYELLVKKIMNFTFNEYYVSDLLSNIPKNTVELAFRTIIKNRANFGGILHSGFIKNGYKNGKGIAATWYPDTICRRILAINSISEKICFYEKDGIEAIGQNAGFYFIDPPYYKAGTRLYRHGVIDHSYLFDKIKASDCDFLLTYDNESVPKYHAMRCGFVTEEIPMRTQKTKKVEHEIFITNGKK